MTDAQYAVYRAHSADSYATEIAESGSMSCGDAAEKAAADFASRARALYDQSGYQVTSTQMRKRL
jgi:hypothetical protein